MPRLAALALLGLVWVAVCGCERETTPPLIQVTGLSPREIEEGDHLVLAGVGFPEGKAAHVSFRGDLHRPGVATVRGVDIDVEAVVAASNEIDLPFTDALEALFVGVGDRAVHTTFSGEVTVAFAALHPGAPPVSGTLRDVWLDVRPPMVSRVAEDALAAEGRRTLSFLGIRPAEEAVASGGILITAIDPGTPADVARFLPGDVVTEVDGLRVLSPSDMVLPDGVRAAALKIRRDGSPREESAELSLLGMSRHPATALFGPVVILGLTTLLLLLLVAPTPRAVVWVEARLWANLRSGGLRRMIGGGRWSVLGGVTATFLAMSLLHAALGSDLDVGLLCLAALTARATMVLLIGPEPPAGEDAPKPRRGVLGGLKRVMQAMIIGAPSAIALACVVLLTGSLRLEDIVRVQTGWPWGWTLFRCPVGIGLGLLYLAPLITEHRVRQPFFAVTEWANLLLLCGLGAAVFLGGWRLPGLASEQIVGHLGLELAGSVVFAAKAWCVVGLVVAARSVLPRMSMDTMSVLSLKWLVPLSAAALGVTVLWLRSAPSAATEMLVGIILFASSAMVVLHGALRARSHARAAATEVALPVTSFL